MSPAAPTPLPTKQLTARWQRLCRRCGVEDGAAITRVFDDLVARYTEAGRHYHNLAHIKRMLRDLDYCSELLADSRDLVEYAIFFHDAIYDTRAADNEKRSAKLAEEALRGLGHPEIAGGVKRLIIATEHLVIPDEEDAHFLLDIDLVSLGQPYAGFKRFGEAIRREYSWVPDEVFNANRAKLFEAFLSRPSIYLTEFFRRSYERQARENLTRGIDELRTS